MAMPSRWRSRISARSNLAICASTVIINSAIASCDRRASDALSRTTPSACTVSGYPKWTAIRLYGLGSALAERWLPRGVSRMCPRRDEGLNRRSHMRCSKGTAGSPFLLAFTRPHRGTSLPRGRGEPSHILAPGMSGRRSSLGATSDGSCLRSRTTLRNESSLRSRITVRTAHRGQTKDMRPSSRVIATSSRVVVGPTRRMAPHVGLLQRTTMASIIRRPQRLCSKHATRTRVGKLLRRLHAPWGNRPLRGTGRPFYMLAPLRVRYG